MDSEDYAYLEHMAMELENEEADALWLQRLATELLDEEDLRAVYEAERDYADVKALENAEQQVTFAEDYRQELARKDGIETTMRKRSMRELAKFLKNECRDHAQRRKAVRLWNYYNSTKEFYDLGLWPNSGKGYLLGGKGYFTLKQILLTAPRCNDQRYFLIRFLTYNGMPMQVAKQWSMIDHIDDDGNVVYHNSTNPRHIERNMADLDELYAKGEFFLQPPGKNGTMFNMRTRTIDKLKTKN